MRSSFTSLLAQVRALGAFDGLVRAVIAFSLVAIACRSEPNPPPSAPAPAASSSAPAAALQNLAWTSDEAAAFGRARAEHKGVLIDFSATWCIPCEELEKELRSGAVYDVIARDFVPLKIDVSEDSDATAARRDRYGVTSLPTVVFITTDGHVVGRVLRVLEADAVLRAVQAAADAVHQHMPDASAAERPGAP